MCDCYLLLYIYNTYALRELEFDIFESIQYLLHKNCAIYFDIDNTSFVIIIAYSLECICTFNKYCLSVQYLQQ